MAYEDTGIPPVGDGGGAKPMIVAIGASAGGVQALQNFFSAAPADLGIAYVVVVHLAPHMQSELAPILATRTVMPVTQVAGKAALESNHVYVIPPDRRLQVTDHEIDTSEFEEPRGQRAPIDFFFRSLATQHSDGFAVVLTGAGTDGTIGVKAVKEAGGIILVQDPEEAEYPSMPRSAIATGLADFILPVHELAAQVGELVRAKNGLVLDRLGEGDEDRLRRVLAHVRVRTGHDFSSYKQSTVLRRIARRMQVTRTEGLEDYYDFLRDNGHEAQALLSDLLISVTTFFRDRDAFEALAKHVVPHLFDGKEASDTIRVWVPGCATGEEAYTLGILLLEEAGRQEVRPGIQIFASDLDAAALAVGREGRYPGNIEVDVSEERLERFFTREGDHYRVKPGLRDLVLFSSHSLLRDPPFAHIDLISCRNLLIYLDRDLQEQVCTTFHYALEPGGYLLLGSSETADNPPHLFRPVDRGVRIYRSMARPGDKPRALPSLLGPFRLREQVPPAGRGTFPAALAADAAKHRQALEKIAPPSILVDEQHRAVHLSDTAGRYLQPPGGPLTADITELVREELRFELRAALHRAFEQHEPSLSIGIAVRFNGEPHRVYLQVKPVIDDPAAPPRRALVLFVEGEAVEQVAAAAGDDSEAVRRLTQELQLTERRLRDTREQSEAATEELRASNEELQSINEEYRSTSEELETSREELQSSNEELQTVNHELKLQLDAVSRAHSDLQNLMAASDFGTLFLDLNLCIKRFTQRVIDLFRLTEADEGRPITDFSHSLDYDSLVKDARAVLADLAPIRREVSTRDRRWYDIRLRPYRTVDGKIDGLVITFIDITDRRTAEDALRASEERLRQQKRLIDQSRDPIFMWDVDDGIVDWNRGSEELYGFTAEEAIGKTKPELLKTSVPGSSFEALVQELTDKGGWSGELAQKTRDGRSIIVETRMELRPVGGRRLVLESARDITERKQLERRQETILRELTHRVKNTLAVVQAIAHQSMRGSGSNQEFIARFDSRLAALASSHNLLVESHWQGAEIGALTRGQLEPYLSANPKRVRIEGEPVILPADVATPLGLILHELATNAGKYGALSRKKGTVSVTWSLKSGNKGSLLRIAWEEQGGPPVKKPVANGFGSTLIKNGLPNANVQHTFGRNGVVCKIELPLRAGAEEGDAG